MLVVQSSIFKVSIHGLYSVLVFPFHVFVLECSLVFSIAGMALNWFYLCAIFFKNSNTSGCKCLCIDWFLFIADCLCPFALSGLVSKIGFHAHSLTGFDAEFGSIFHAHMDTFSCTPVNSLQTVAALFICLTCADWYFIWLWCF